MQKKTALRLTPAEAANAQVVQRRLIETLGLPANHLTGYQIIKSSLDARSRNIWVNLTVNAFLNEPFQERALHQFNYQHVHQAPYSVIIVGAGPAGLFAALQLLELGIRPILLERGKDVRARRRDLAQLNKHGIVNADSNYCFGEGGAGTYSDGKLYTRSNKRGDIDRILHRFVAFGATERILYESHPHIGTNKLPHIITAMRETLEAYGAVFHFDLKVTGLIMDGDEVSGVRTVTGDIIPADAVILATGHSARDVFELMQANDLLVEAKPLAIGVRVEHPQALIDSIQYHCANRGEWLPPASYSLVQQVNERGVFSFCMCPGGIIAPAATAPGELVVNGWSPSKRNNPYANSGMVVQVEMAEASKHLAKLTGDAYTKIPPALRMMRFQQMVEQECFIAGGGNLKAPAQRLADFVQGKRSADLPDCSYQPGLSSVRLQEVLPGFIHTALASGFNAFGKRMRGYLTNEAVVVATESRTSSPVRIPRDEINCNHPQLRNFYPCGEGAGYAGGIVSAAMDGERVARVCSQRLVPLTKV